MRTDITTIDSNGNGVQLALNRIEGLADVGMLARKDRLHLRLLAEETFSMVTTIVGEFSAKFWAESGEDEYRIILQADADITEQEEAQLLSVSSSGENTAGKGIMARIWKHYKAALKENRKAAVMEAARGMTYSEAELLYGKLGTIRFDGEDGEEYAWSLKQYKSNVQKLLKEDDSAKGRWDELEKSIVANIASDVRVGVTEDHVKMVIYLNVA